MENINNNLVEKEEVIGCEYNRKYYTFSIFL